MKLDIITQDFHRNGVSGAPFNVYLADDEDGDIKLIVAFAEKENTAVFSLERLSRGDVHFFSNSWRGDIYRAALDERLRAAV